MTRALVFASIFAALSLGGGVAAAQGKEKARKPTKTQKCAKGQTCKDVDFLKGDTLEGATPSAGGELIRGRTGVKYKSLLRYRTNFRDMILKSAENL